LSAGAFSDEELVKTATRIVCVMADNGKLSKLSAKLKVSGIPDLRYFDPDGNEVGKMSDRSAGGMIKQINEIADKFNRAPKWAEDQDKGFDAARADGKPAIVYFGDASPKSQMSEKAFGELPLAELLGKFVWIKKSMDWKSDDAKKLGVSGPALWVVDPKAEDPFAKPLKKLGLPKAGAALKGELGPILKSWKSEPAPKKEEPKKEEEKETPEGGDK